MNARVSDDVWRGLEPSQGHRRWAVRLWVAAAAVFVLGFGGTVLWTSPLVTPNLIAVMPMDMSSLERRNGDLRVQAVMENQSPGDVTVLEAELADPGLALLRVEDLRAGDPSPFPVTLAAGERVEFALRFRVADCTAVDIFYPFQLRATVQRPWGEMVVGVSGSFEVQGPEGDLVDFWCGR